VFAIGSQIFLRDSTRYREETNLTRMQLEDGIANVLDRVPAGDSVVESFYVGGGASLFLRAPLVRLAAATADYAPFYWEDVEWGWRARSQGYRVLFAPRSRVRHTHRATISRYYTPRQVEEITERNRLLFHLRNVTSAPPWPALERAASLAPEHARFFAGPAVIARILRMRLWNWRAPSTVEFALERAAASR
jgi:GT2 family glycosyltransferase